MGDATVGHRAANLPWLCPADASFFALTGERPDARVLAADPAAVLLLLRYTRPTPPPSDLRLDPVSFSESILAEAAARHLAATTTGRLNLSHAAVSGLVAFAQTAARVATGVAARTRLAPPAAAAATALVAPLGWFLVASTDSAATRACCDAIRGGEDPRVAQERFFGLTHDGVARRAAGRWRLPGWLAAVVGNLGLPVETAVRFGAPRHLFVIVREAIRACETSLTRYGIVPPASGPANTEVSRLADERVEAAVRVRSLTGPPASAPEPLIPVPVLVTLLRSEARARRAEAMGRLDRLHAELDRAVIQLQSDGEQFDIRVREAKLASLAELAAGAGHEINNPLAVISGNAQLLLTRVGEPEYRSSLETIVRQCRRISEIVRDLMQFARPRPPTPRAFDFSTWLGQVTGELQPAAAHLGVDLRVDSPDEPLAIRADPAQLGRALTALIRNGIDAAGEGGWVRVAAGRHATRVTIAVEDSGPGPTAAAAEHMFDPFYSGRAAGRGRGLGLPTAWRLARENGGEVRYEPAGGGPTRFVLEIPLPPQYTLPMPGQQAA